MSTSELAALLVLGASLSFTPGPNTALSTALAVNHGLARALRFVCAVPLGWGLMLGATTLGLGALVLAVPALRWGIKLLGMAYLLYLAWVLARASQMAQADARRLNVTFWQGVALQFINIKAWMLALTINSGWIVGHADASARLAIVLPVLLAFAFFSNFAYAAAGALLRHWLARGRRLLWFNRIIALVLLLTALWMLRL